MKRTILQCIVALTLAVVITGAGSVLADLAGLDVTPQSYACPASSGAGGNC